jgi:hypothetical protein
MRTPLVFMEQVFGRSKGVQFTEGPSLVGVSERSKISTSSGAILIAPFFPRTNEDTPAFTTSLANREALPNSG